VWQTWQTFPADMLPVCHNRQTRQKAGRQAMRLRDQPPVPVVGLWAIGSDAVTCRIGKPKRGGFVAMRQVPDLCLVTLDELLGEDVPDQPDSH
jgi:hypothetical protein